VTGGRFAAALSEHPLPAHAVGEAIGQVLDRLGAGPDPDLALLFVTPAHAGAIDDMAAAVRATLDPVTLIGCTAEAVLGNGREVEAGPALALWAGSTGPVTAFALPGANPLPPPPDDAAALLLLADPFSYPVEEALARLANERPGLPVVGGMASAARGPGGNRLLLDGTVATSGAVGAYLGPGVAVATVVSQGCRPVGMPLVVTQAEGNVIHQLAGQPALERLQQLVAASGEDDRLLLAQGLHLGRVIDEHKADFGRGDFLVRNVLGADRATGAIAVGDEIEVGATVQFHVRDAATADEDLRALLAGRAADAALLFTCNGRGTRLFPQPDHDAGVLSELLGDPPTAGFFAAGELGPVGGRNFLHGFTASVVLLAGTASAGRPTPAAGPPPTTPTPGSR
jgi:small ligand-binding sensory domain FIST